jgi:hypothetical protein
MPEAAPPALRIAARRAGFRRAGLAHPAQPVLHPAGTFTPDQVEALLAETMLMVEIIPPETATPDTRPEGDGADAGDLDNQVAGNPAEAAPRRARKAG